MKKLTKDEIRSAVHAIEQFMGNHPEVMAATKGDPHYMEVFYLKTADRKLIDNFEELKAIEVSETLIRG